jgi:tRNA modification GTPase
VTAPAAAKGFADAGAIALPLGGGPIAACATPHGHGAISIVRVSGPDLWGLLRAVCGSVPPPREARPRDLRDADGVFDRGLVTYFPGPRSYTGEDVAELACHGNPLLVERLLSAVCAAGARAALPGEFTRRAFRNGKMDLTRAEAVLQAIGATSAAGLAVAREGLDGAVAQLADTLRDGIVDVAAGLEAAIDYPGEAGVDEDVAFAARCAALADEARAAAGTWRAGHAAVEGACVALVGTVNAGKSSLFNALLGRTRALVSPAAGTTRDVVEAALPLDSLRVRLLDTAGERATDDPIEAAGIALAAAAAAEADLLLVCVPCDRPPDAATIALLSRTEGRPRRVVHTFADRAPLPSSAIPDALRVSVVTGEGVDALRDGLPSMLRGEAPGGAARIIASQRQRDALRDVSDALELAARALNDGAGAAVAVEAAYAALAALDALVGRDTREDVLDRLFARFCIGK